MQNIFWIISICYQLFFLIICFFLGFNENSPVTFGVLVTKRQMAVIPEPLPKVVDVKLAVNIGSLETLKGCQILWQIVPHWLYEKL